MQELPKMYFSPYSRDVVSMMYFWSRRTSTPIGLICSLNQVRAGGGYTGFDPYSLVEFAREQCWTDQPLVVCRDHLGKTENNDVVHRTIETDEDAGFRVVHLHTENLALIKTCLETYGSLQFELGTGEVTPVNPRLLQDLAFLARENRLEKSVAYLSFPTGCKISADGVTNVNIVDTFACNRASELGFALKGHNSDYSNAATLQTLKRAGIAAINVAPQIGVVATRAYVNFARMTGYDLEPWESCVIAGNEWSRWGPMRHAVDLGGQYHFNRLPEAFARDAYEYVRDEIGLVMDFFQENFAS